MHPQDITDLVRAVEALDSEDAFAVRLSTEQWRRLAPYLERRLYDTGELLIRHGARERVAYLLESGRLQVFMTGGAPGSHRIALLRAGSIVGEPGLFVDAPRMANVEATTASVVWALSGERVARLAVDEPALLLALALAAGSVMAVRMRANLERGIPIT